jgi:hypothetical protein
MGILVACMQGTLLCSLVRACISPPATRLRRTKQIHHGEPGAVDSIRRRSPIPSPQRAVQNCAYAPKAKLLHG